MKKMWDDAGRDGKKNGVYSVTAAYADTPSPITKAEAGLPVTLNLMSFEALVI